MKIGRFPSFWVMPKKSFEGLTHPRYVVVLAGAINGTDGVSNSGIMKIAVSYDDTTSPDITSVEYDGHVGVLDVLFDEAVSSIDATKVSIYDTDDTAIPVDGDVQYIPGGTAARMNLDVSGEMPATISILVSGVTDIWGNANSAVMSYDVTVTSQPINNTQTPVNGTITPPVNGTITPPVNGTITPARKRHDKPRP